MDQLYTASRPDSKRRFVQTCKICLQTKEPYLASTKRTLVETDQIGNHTLAALDKQTEQIHGIKASTDAIDHNLRESEQLIRGLGFMGAVRNLFSRGSSNTSASDEQSLKGSGGLFAGAPRPGQNAGPKTTSANNPAVGRGASRLLERENARKSQAAQSASGGSRHPGMQDPDMDKDLDEIGDLLAGLKHKSAQMKDTIKYHNEVLPDITDAITRDQDRISKQRQELQKRMR